MNDKTKLFAVAMVALLIAIPGMAQTPEASILPVEEPLDVGGTILQPGTYLIRVLPSATDRTKVQITSEDRSTIYATVLTVPHTLEPGEQVPNTVFVYYPAGEGMPRALRTWFARDPRASIGGHDIVYDETRARQLARLSNATVTSYAVTTPVEALDTARLTVITPDQPVTVTTPEPVPVTELDTTTMISSETAPVQTADTQSSMEMPRTASRVPLMALMGLLAVLAAATLRVARS